MAADVRRPLLSWCCLALLISCVSTARGDDGYRLWLRYDPIAEPSLLEHYRASVTQIVAPGNSPTMGVIRDELSKGLGGLIGGVETKPDITQDGALLVGTPATSPAIASLGLDLSAAGDEGYVLKSVLLDGGRATVVAANTEVGALYGAFHFLRLIQTGHRVSDLLIAESPHVERRILNHWDNLDRTVERGYAGFSLWDWHKLPDYLDPRYTDYARANASIGINGSVLTNVNANATSLTPMYLEKAAALADVFRPYGIRVYLTARFSAPIEIGGLETADPLDPAVRDWWRAKAEEVYRYIPDFGASS
jgi:alpha-glucuronidase